MEAKGKGPEFWCALFLCHGPKWQRSPALSSQLRACPSGPGVGTCSAPGTEERIGLNYKKLWLPHRGTIWGYLSSDLDSLLGKDCEAVRRKAKADKINKRAKWKRIIQFGNEVFAIIEPLWPLRESDLTGCLNKLPPCSPESTNMPGSSF